MIFPGLSVDSVDCLLTLHEIEDGLLILDSESCSSSSAPSVIFPGLPFDSVERWLTLQEIADVLLILDFWSCSSSFCLSLSSEICFWSPVRKLK